MPTSTQHPETDLFGAALPPPTQLLELCGRLEQDVQVRTQACDHGAARLVLCADLVEVGAGMRRVHIELPLDHNTSRFAADAIAAQLKRGTWVDTAAPLAGITVTLHRAAYIKPSLKASA